MSREKNVSAITVVDEVETRFFTVVGSTYRFMIKTLEHREPGGWAFEKVVPLISDELFEVAKRHELIRQAHVAFEAWSRCPGRELRLAAIEALQAVEDGVTE